MVQGGSFLPHAIIVIKHFILMQKNQPHNLSSFYCNFKLVLIVEVLCVLI